MPHVYKPKNKNTNFVRNISKKYKLVPHLDRYLANEVEGFEFKYEAKEHDDAWHPSGHCIPSATDLYRIATEEGEREPFPVSLMKTFLVGHFWHQLLQFAVVDLGFAEPSAIERKAGRVWGKDLNLEIGANDHYDALPYHWATGAADVAPCAIPGYGDYIIDFKTMGSHDFKREGLPTWAEEKYEAQINIYMELFDIDKALIVGIQKDSPHEFKEIAYERNQPLIDTIFDKWKFVSECIDEGREPSKIENDQFELEFTGPVG